MTVTFCRYCGGSSEEGHEPGYLSEDREVGRCPVLAFEVDVTQASRLPSSLRPHQGGQEGRQGVLHQSASSAVTYTIDSKGRGCRLSVPPRLLKEPSAGTMTREEYLAWRDAS